MELKLLERDINSNVITVTCHPSLNRAAGGHFSQFLTRFVYPLILPPANTVKNT